MAKWTKTVIIPYDELEQHFGTSPPPATFDISFRFEDVSGDYGDAAIVSASNDPPAAPSGLAIADNVGTAELTWDKNLTDTDLRLIRIYRHTADDWSAAASIAAVAPDATAYQDEVGGIKTRYYWLQSEDWFDQQSGSSTGATITTATTVRGWSHNISFSANDFETMDWGAGSIFLADTAEAAYVTIASDSGAMGDITHIFFDSAFSSSQLNWSTAASEAVGSNRILICTAGPVVGATKSAKFQVMGGGSGQQYDLLTAGHIAADTITANEIAANVITAAEIDADAITACKIDVATLSAITADMGTLTAGSMTGTAASFGNDAGTRLNDWGFQIEACANYETPRALSFVDSLDTVLSTLWVIDSGIAHTVELRSTEVSTDNSTLRTYAETAAGITALNEVYAKSGDNSAYVSINNNSVTGASISYAADVHRINGGLVKIQNPPVLIGDTTTTTATCGLIINQGTTDDHILEFKSSDVAHGVTDVVETDTYARYGKISGTDGGLVTTGLADANERGAILQGIAVLDSAEKDTSACAYVMLEAYKKDGAGVQAGGTDANLVVIKNLSTTRFIFDAEGSAHADVAWVAFDEHDDIALLDSLETTMKARKDSVKSEMVEFLRENQTMLEELGIAHFEEDRPNNAMVNWTKLSMLLVGGIRQLGERMNTIEQKLLTT